MDLFCFLLVVILFVSSFFFFGKVDTMWKFGNWTSGVNLEIFVDYEIWRFSCLFVFWTISTSGVRGSLTKSTLQSAGSSLEEAKDE